MPVDSSVKFRLTVVAEALRLFAEQGYEATSVDEIAEAAGISRRTFFRQFRAKEDVVFADHEILLAQAADFLAGEHDDPWDAVREAAVLVFEAFSNWRDITRRRYGVVHEVSALRDREIVTIFRYERLFVDYLRRALPDESDLALVQFAAMVTATHNYVLRRMARDGSRTTVAELRTILGTIAHGHERGVSDDDMVVAVFPKALSARQVADLVQRKLDGS